MHGVKVGGKSQRSKDYKDIYRVPNSFDLSITAHGGTGLVVNRLCRSVTLALEIMVTVVGLGLWREGQSGNFLVELDLIVLTWYLNY